jgi:hypothetical protein
MIRSKCPKCASLLSIPESEAGTTISCPSCGQKLRVPMPAAAPAAPTTRSQPATADVADPGYSVQPENDPPRPAKRPRAFEDTEDDSEEPVVSRRRVVEDADDSGNEEEPVADDEAPRPRKRRKKKKHQPRRLKGAYIALVAGGLFLVGVAALIFFLIYRGAFDKEKPDPAQVLAELQQVGAHIERDQQSPEQPITGINLSGLEFRPSLLARLAAFPQLRSLNLSSTKTSDINLEHLAHVTTLKRLDLGQTKVTGGGMQFLKGMVELEDLSLRQTLVTDAGLRELKGLTRLKRINLDGTLASGLELQAAIPGLQIIR